MSAIVNKMANFKSYNVGLQQSANYALCMNVNL